MRPWHEENVEDHHVHALPLGGKPERLHLYQWIGLEERYVHDKYDNRQQRDEHDATLRERYDIEEFWTRQIVQYLDRARIALEAAKELRADSDGTGVGKDAMIQARARFFEMKAQQAVAKCMMTAKGCAESMIRSFGNMPMPGVSSGEVEKWD